jgi:ribosomal protein L11 methyltransferase
VTGDPAPGGWVSLRIEPAADRRDAALAALFAAGAQGVQEDGPALVTHLPADADIPSLRAALDAAAPGAAVSVQPAAAVDWSEAWKSRLVAHQAGRLTIAPPWLAHDLDSSSTIVVDPGMAFGTGDHPTTRGVVRLMQGVLRPGLTVADLGAGSAVLAIAAAKLGAARVAAIELDPDAIGNAVENVERNGVAHIVHVIEGDAALLLPLVAPVDVVLANIISSVLIDLLPAIASALAPGGTAILGGILVEEREAMREALRRNGWATVAEDEEERWWSVSVARA